VIRQNAHHGARGAGVSVAQGFGNLAGEFPGWGELQHLGVRWLDPAWRARGRGKGRLSCRVRLAWSQPDAAEHQAQGWQPSESVWSVVSRREQTALTSCSLRPKQEKPFSGSQRRLGQNQWFRGLRNIRDSGVAAWAGIKGVAEKGCRQIRKWWCQAARGGGVRRGTRKPLARGRLLGHGKNDEALGLGDPSTQAAVSNLLADRPDARLPCPLSKVSKSL